MSTNHSFGPLPTLQALRVLEAAVRHQSYSSAAQELGLTHGAVSRQIETLGHWVGAALFVRTGRRMSPTEAARSLVTRTREALRILEEAFGHPVFPRSGQGLRISTTQAIARLFLLPRLSDLNAVYPNLVTAVEVTSALDAGSSDTIDAAIRYGPGSWPGVESLRLADERLFPVASPALLAEHSDWRAAPRIETPYQSWGRWFEQTGVAAAAAPPPTLELPDIGLALDAATRGLGVALARARLVAPLLNAGALVRASDIELEDIYCYWFVYPPTRSSERLQNLGRWLADQFREGDPAMH